VIMLMRGSMKISCLRAGLLDHAMRTRAADMFFRPPLPALPG